MNNISDEHFRIEFAYIESKFQNLQPFRRRSIMQILYRLIVSLFRDRKKNTIQKISRNL